MTHELFECEKQYRIAMAIAKSMLQKGLISGEDYSVIDTIMQGEFKPILSHLYPKTT